MVDPSGVGRFLREESYKPHYPVQSGIFFFSKHDENMNFYQGIRRQKFWRFLKNIWTFFLDLFLSCLPTHCVDWRTRTAILEITNFCHLVIAVAESSKCFCSVHCLEFKLLKTVYKNLMLQGGMWPICSGIDKPAVIYWLEKSDAEKRDVLHLSASVPSWFVAFLYANFGSGVHKFLKNFSRLSLHLCANFMKKNYCWTVGFWWQNATSVA